VFDRDVRVSWFGARLLLCGSVENKVDLCRFATKHMPYLLSVISPSVREGNRQVPPSRGNRPARTSKKVDRSVSLACILDTE
jgi:hypothetical protein